MWALVTVGAPPRRSNTGQDAEELDEDGSRATVHRVRTDRAHHTPRSVRRAGVAVLFAVLATGCSSENAPVRELADPPPSITSTEGTVELEHETGLRVTATVTDTRAELPFLWDGNWRDTTTGEELHIGGPETPLADCWNTPTDGDGTDAWTASVRCTQNRLSRVAYRDGYDAAATELQEALDTIGRESSNWGTYCHIGGYAAAAAAVLAGEDPRTLMRTKTSFCDYSVLHGAASATVSLYATDPVGALTATCTPDPASSIPEFSYGSQCWHGGGFGLARIHRFDVERAATACLGAPEPGWVSNCIEGVNAFVSVHQGRAVAWSLPRPDAGRCASASEALITSREYQTVCYRTVAETTRGADLDARRRTTDLLVETCRTVNTPAGRDGCWAGVGNALSLEMLDTPEDTSTAEVLLRRCEEASAAETECLTRAMIGMVRNDQRLVGIEETVLVDLVRPAKREELRVRLRAWLESIGGRSEG
jgi:hypothetical protein